MFRERERETNIRQIIKHLLTCCVVLDTYFYYLQSCLLEINAIAEIDTCLHTFVYEYSRACY